MEETYLTTKEAAKMIRTNRQAIYFAIRKGRLKAKQEGASWKIALTDLQDYIKYRYSREKSTYRTKTGTGYGELVYDKDKGLYSPRQVSRMMNIPIMKIYYWLRCGYIPHKKYGSMYILNINDLENLHICDGKLIHS